MAEAAGEQREPGGGGTAPVLHEELGTDATRTTMVHPGGRGRREWWRRAVVYELPNLGLQPAHLEPVLDGARLASRLGADAMLIHPVTPPEEAQEAAATLTRRTYQLGLRLMVSVPDVEDRTELVRQWLHRGVDGVALPPGEVPARARDVGMVHALVAELNEEGILSGVASATDPEELLVQLQEVWPHHLRDDRLATVRWSADAIRRTVTEAYEQRDPLGAPAAWTLHDPLGGGYTTDRRHPLDPRRFRAAALLTLALPGAVYLRQGEEVGLLSAVGDSVADRARTVREAVQEQRGRQGSTYEMFRHALHLRRELRLGTGPLGWVTGFRHPDPGQAVALVNREVLVLTNTGATPMSLPAHLEILHASDALVAASDGGAQVPPDTTVWATLPAQRR